MPDHRLHLGTRFRQQGREFLVEAALSDGRLAVKDVLAGDVSAVAPAQLATELFAGRLELLGNADQAASLATHVIRARVGDLADLPQDDPLRREILRRIAYVERVLTETRSRRSERVLTTIIRDVAAALDDRSPPSWSTLYRWVRSYEDAGRDVRALVPVVAARGNRRPKSSGRPREHFGQKEYERARVVDRIVDEVIRRRFLARGRRSVASVHRDVESQIREENRLRDPSDQLPIPHVSTIHRKIETLDPFDVTAAREGRRVAKEKFHAVKQGPRCSRPLERVEFDHTRLDLMVVDTETRLPLGRPWLTSMLDGFSRMVLGMHLSFRAPGYLAVMQCLRHAAKPKAYVKDRYPSVEHDWPTWGLPDLLVVDNGKEFRSRHFDDACLQLGIGIDHAPPRCGAYKGAVERWFGTQNTRLLHELPGTTFSDIFERGDYDPQRHAVISLDALLELVHVWIVDVYNMTPHRGLRDVPYHRWTDGIAERPPRLPARGDDLDVLVGCVAERCITRSGIQLFTLHYNSPELGLIRRALPEKAKARIKYDPGDLSAVYVLDPGRNAYLRVPALDQEYTAGLTLWQHDIIRAYARRTLAEKVDAEALCRARQQMEEIVARERVAQRSLKSRQRAARYLDLGQPSAPGREPAQPSRREPSHPTGAAGGVAGAGDGRCLPGPRVSLEPGGELDLAGWGASYDLPQTHRRGD